MVEFFKLILKQPIKIILLIFCSIFAIWNPALDVFGHIVVSLGIGLIHLMNHIYSYVDRHY